MRRRASTAAGCLALVVSTACANGAAPNPFDSAQIGETEGDDGQAPNFETGDPSTSGGDDGGTTWSMQPDGTSTSGTPPPSESSGDTDSTSDGGTTVGIDPSGSSGTSTGFIDETTTGAGATTGTAQMCPNDAVGGLPMSLSDTTLGASDQFSSTCGGVGAPDFSVSFTAPAAGNYRIHTGGSQLDTVLYVLDGTCDGDQIVCNDDDGCGGTSTSALTVALAAAQQVTIVVDGFGLVGDDFTLFVDACTDCIAGAVNDCGGGGTTGGIGS